LYTYDEPGSHTCRVRAYDDIGQTGDKTVEFWMVNPANTPPQADLQASVTNGNAPLAVDFDASGTTDDSGIQLYEWDFDNDGEYEFSGTDSQRSYIFGRGGLTPVNLRVTDDDFATDTATVGITVSGGFSLTTVATDLNVNEPMDIALCGIGGAELFPTIVFQDWTNKSLKVVKATSTDGTSWGPVIDATAPEDDSGYSPVIARGNGDRPVVVFGEKTPTADWQLAAVWPGYADNDKYDIWNGPWYLDSSNGTGGHNAMYEYAGTLHVASVANANVSGTQSIYYYRSDGTTGNSWPTTVKVMDGPSSGGIADVAIGRSRLNIFTYPLIGFANYIFSGDDPESFGAVSTTDIAGESWNAPTLISEYLVGFVSTVLADDYPLMVAGGAHYPSTLYGARATTSTGSSWPATAQEIGSRGANCDLAIVDGKPAVCYQSNSVNLQYMTAANAQGTLWNEPFNVATGPSVGAECAMEVISGTNPVIVFYDAEYDAVKVASWQ
jgi:PKD repeat protein